MWTHVLAVSTQQGKTSQPTCCPTFWSSLNDFKRGSVQLLSYLSLSKSCSCDPGSGCTTNWSCGAVEEVLLCCCRWGLGDGGEGRGGGPRPPDPGGGGGGVILLFAPEDSVEAVVLLCPLKMGLSKVLVHFNWPTLTLSTRFTVSSTVAKQAECRERK